MQHCYFDSATYACLYTKNRKQIFYFELLFANFSYRDIDETHIVMHILIGMFNINPMIPHYLQLVEYSQSVGRSSDHQVGLYTSCAVVVWLTVCSLNS